MIKLLVITMAVAVSMQATAAEVCSKKAAEDKVNEICKAIEEKGVDAKKDWPKGLKYDNCGKNYVWVQDTDPGITMVMHPIKTGLDNTSLKDSKTPKGIRLFFEFDKEAKANKNGVWSAPYDWAKDEGSAMKTSFVKLCKLKSGGAWIAGSGGWVSEIK